MTSEDDPLLRLGRTIVEDMKSADDHDTLTQWMAHHLADLIERSEGDEAVRRECMVLIRNLWLHRASFANRRGVASDTESLLNAIKKRPLSNAPTEGWAATLSRFDEAVSLLRRSVILAAAKDQHEQHEEALAQISQVDSGSETLRNLRIILDWSRRTEQATKEELELALNTIETMVKSIT